MKHSLIINFWPSGKSSGHVKAVKEIIERDLGETASIFDSRILQRMRSHHRCDRVMQELRAKDPEYLYLIGSPSSLDMPESDFARLLKELSGRIVLYWEPDGWGRGKRLPSTNRQVMQRADVLLHSGGVENVQALASSQARVRFTPDTYCHLTFAAAESAPPEPDTTFDVSMIANNVTRSWIPVPGLTGLPDSFARWEVARRAHKEFGGQNFHLRGDKWPRRWSVGRLDFAEQTTTIRSSRISITWDHFRQLPHYASDRLPISLISGRPHLMTQRPGMQWLPVEELAITAYRTPKELIQGAREWLSLPPQDTFKMGLKNWEWARNRLSSRGFAQYAVSQVRSEIDPPNLEPWSSLSLLPSGLGRSA